MSYVHLPFYGSFTVRDDGGDMVDTLYPVLSWLTWPLSIGKWTVEGIETRAQLLDSDGLLRQSSDPYIISARPISRTMTLLPTAVS